MDSLMVSRRTSGRIVCWLALLLLGSLFLPCAKIPVAFGSLRWEYVTVVVFGSLFRSHVYPHAVYLLSVPFVVLALIWVFRAGTAAVIASLSGAAFVVLPNLPIPQVWPGALWIFLMRLSFAGWPIDAPTIHLPGFYTFIVLLLLLGLSLLFHSAILWKHRGVPYT
jgi:hypothetical protein